MDLLSEWLTIRNGLMRGVFYVALLQASIPNFQPFKFDHLFWFNKYSWPLFWYSSHFHTIQWNNLQFKEQLAIKIITIQAWHCVYWFTLKLTSFPQDNVQNGPSIRRTVSSIWFLMRKFGYQHVHSCSIRPTTWPGGDDTSNDCKQHGKQQLEQANGR